MQKITTITALFGVLALSACSPNPTSIQPSYVSPMQFSGLSCAAMGTQRATLQAGLTQVEAAQQDKANEDTAAMAVALLVFWPAALFINNADDYSAAIADMRGELIALNSAAVQRGC